MRKLILLFFYLPFIGLAQQTLNQSIFHDNLKRDYIIHIPSSYDNETPFPLVLCFHGYGGSASGISYTNFNYVSDTASFSFIRVPLVFIGLVPADAVNNVSSVSL